jgi:peptide chain release factor 1
MEAKLKKLLDRFKEVESLLAQSETFQDKELFKKLSQEHAYLSKIKEVWEYLTKLQLQLIESKNLLITEKDSELISIIKEEITHLENEIGLSDKRLKTLLVPPDPKDDRNVILEIRAGTGGEEAALFVADCARMYKGYADRKGWKFEPLSSTPSDLGGFREYVVALSGPGVHRFMQYEGGTHRVQRVPKTEAQGRLHTSAVTIAVLIEPEEGEEITINEKDLKIDTYRASGAGGQHVNVTDSAVRITHLPTNTVVACQDERSQHKNKEKAMRLLYAKIADEQRKKQQQEMSELRSKQVGTGDRSERIRTYNFPQNRVTDHRINLTLYKLDQVIDGDLDDITEALIAFYYQEKLAS